MAPAGEYALLMVDDADAAAPLAAAATFTRPTADVAKLHHALLSASITPKLLRARTCHQYVVAEFSPLTTAPLFAVLIQPVSHPALLVVSTQYSNEVALLLAPYVSARLVP